VRLLLVVLMLVSLAMSASLPRAFDDLGLWVGGAYALQQIGRTLFMVIALRGHPLEANFQRILAWCVVSSAFALAGGLAHGNARALLWLGAVGVDLLGGWSASPPRASAGPVPRTGPSRAATSPSAARRSS
jgi:low temperature requirement protein LtrA